LPKSSKPYPEDPLFESKQPREKGTALVHPVFSVAAIPDPQPPRRPETQLVSPLGEPDHPPRSALFQGNDSEASSEGSTPPAPSFARSADFRWLQGLLEKDYRGRYSLRYCDATVADRWGGKVSLVPNPRLGQFQDGDVVRVEGMLVPLLKTLSNTAWDYEPRYRLIAIRAVPESSDSRQR
jgi:hypothetical protein